MALFAALLLRQALPALADLPFELVRDQIWIAATLNGMPVHAVFDTGAGANVVDEKVASATGTAKGQGIHAYGNGSQVTSGWETKGLSLRLGGTSIETPVAFALPLRGITGDKTHSLDAIVGYGLLRSYVVEIDYPNRRLRLYDPRTYPAPPGFSSVPVRLRNDIPTVEGTLTLAAPYARSVKATFEIDTGSGMGVDLTNRFVRRERLDRVPTEVSDNTGTAGLGGNATTRGANSASALLGSELLGGACRMVLSEKGKMGRKADYDAVLGGGALQVCDLVLDYSHSILYLRSMIQFHPAQGSSGSPL